MQHRDPATLADVLDLLDPHVRRAVERARIPDVPDAQNDHIRALLELQAACDEADATLAVRCAFLHGLLGVDDLIERWRTRRSRAWQVRAVLGVPADGREAA